MSVCILSALSDGMEARIARIECSFARGYSGIKIVGNAAEVCRDGKERAKTALEQLAINIPARSLVVSLTPADVKKEGNQFDLPLALCLGLLITPVSPQVDLDRWIFAAELGLSGEIRPVKHVISYAIAGASRRFTGMVVADGNARELQALSKQNSSAFSHFSFVSFPHLRDVLEWLKTGASPRRLSAKTPPTMDRHSPNFDDMLLTPELEQAALATAVGRHSLLMRGTPGAGKSMLATRLPSLLPKMSGDEQLQSLRIHSSHGTTLPDALVSGIPPFRSPHHQASAQAILGSPDRPGELALAHGGILFLDEINEFRRDLLEALREPLETGEVRVSRVRKKAEWLCQVTLVAACNNCPCGYSGSSQNTCQCSQSRLLQYRQRLSGPILERIDLHLNMPEPGRLSMDFLNGKARKDQTQRLRRQADAARQFSLQRNRQWGIRWNRDLPGRKILASSEQSPKVFESVLSQEQFARTSYRTVVRALRLARTLADLQYSQPILREHFEQAMAWQPEAAARQRGEIYDE